MRCSVIIPAYNSEKTISLCLESVLNQSLPPQSYEVILVDDGSTDGTAKIAEKYPVKVIYQPNQGPAAARNNAAAKSGGDVLVFTDSDCRADFHFLERLIGPIESNSQIVGVQGSYKTQQRQFMARFSQAEIETRYKKMAKSEYIDFIGTYAAAYKKDVFIAQGGFDTGFPLASGEDAEFSYKLNRNGYKMVFEPQAFVYHQHPAAIKKYLKSKFFRGYWRVRLYAKHPQKMISDSYTPQSLKFEVLSVPVFTLFALLTFLNSLWMIPLTLIVLGFILLSIPFFKLVEEKDLYKKIFIPLVLFLRAASIFSGTALGAMQQSWRKFYEKLRSKQANNSNGRQRISRVASV